MLLTLNLVTTEDFPKFILYIKIVKIFRIKFKITRNFNLNIVKSKDLICCS